VIPVSSIAPELPNNLRQLLAHGALPELGNALDASNDSGMALDEIEYRPLLPEPGKIICIGRNYAAHAAEGGAATPTFPEIFYRGASSLIAHKAPIIRPLVSDNLDYEGEIAFVVGSLCRHASEDTALDCIAGYTLFNDATIRDYQRFSSQWTIGKNFDGTGAFGPELVTADELPPGIVGLTLTTTLNGELMQEGRTDNLVFSIRQLIKILSECMTLHPGDVVVTGTPSGVGFARKPPLWMEAGDTVEIEVDGIGKLVNTVQDETER
jgi:acylpyruvate hydrolase